MLLFCKCHAVSPTTNQHKHVFEEHVASLCTLSPGTSHTHTENSCNIFNGHWNSIDHFPALSVTLVSNWLKSAIESPKRENKLTNIQVSEVDECGWNFLRHPYLMSLSGEKFQLWWTATKLLVQQLSTHSFRSTAKWKRQDVLKSTYVQLIWPCKCCFFFKEIYRVYEVSR